ncbi:ABC transporter substrate-binding protein [Candidatus Magnetomoraceae bacterium gMMP-1]
MKSVKLIVILSMFFSINYAMASGYYAGKKILYINSYHLGYKWSDKIINGILEALKNTRLSLKVIYMDTRRNQSETFKKSAALKAKAVIENFKPDVVIASDDNASKYLIMPYYKDTDLPFVFCGVNWDASVYGFPYKNTTGMVEVLPIPQLIHHISKYARGKRIGFFSSDVFTEQKIVKEVPKLLNIKYSKVYLVKNFKEWKEKFLRLQDEVDMIIMSNFIGIKNWDDKIAQSFVEKYTKIPTGTMTSWNMYLVLLGVTQIPEEQGQWAAKAALKILDGIPPHRIPITHNKQGKLFFNKRIAKKLGIIDIPAGAEVIH